MVEYQELSPAEWFKRNSSIAGFDNPVRALYTSIREMVENSLDACEEEGILPEIFVLLRRLNEDVYQIYVADNGSGVSGKNIPKAFAKLLVGTKFTLRQSRGTFGLGGKMAIMYGQISTGGTVRVISSKGDGKVWEYVLKIDIEKNEPIVLKKRVIKSDSNWKGTVVSFSISGDWSRARSKVIQYFKNTGIVAPYANIFFVDPDGVLYYFRRTTKKMPKKPKEVKPHPYGVDLDTFSRMVSSSNSKDMVSFLTKSFHRVGKKTAINFLKFCGIDPGRDPKTLTLDEMARIVRSMRKFSFLPPSPEGLSPLGEDLLREGIIKELQPDWCDTIQRPPKSYMGHPFIVEVGLAYGGKIKEPFSLYRFANRIPLLYDARNDVSSRVINQDINWGDYKVKKDSPIAIIVHICSTKIPYKTAGKEYIADIPEIRREIKLAIQQCARGLRRYLNRIERRRIAERRLSILSRYIDKFVESLVSINKTDKKLSEKVKDVMILKGILMDMIKGDRVE